MFFTPQPNWAGGLLSSCKMSIGASGRLSAVNFSFPFDNSNMLHLIDLIFLLGNHDQKRKMPIDFGADPILGLVTRGQKLKKMPMQKVLFF
jgi:hypothetical protein